MTKNNQQVRIIGSSKLCEREKKIEKHFIFTEWLSGSKWSLKLSAISKKGYRCKWTRENKSLHYM